MKKIMYFSVFFILINLFCFNNAYAKYVIEEKYEIVNIKNVDSESPYINGVNYDVQNEIFNEDVTIDYEDNLKVKYAKYWYNSETCEFDGEGQEFDSGTIFSLDGWYKIEVSDMYNNVTTYIFGIDKKFDNIELSCTDITDEGGSLKIEATDFVSGIQKIELYIEDKLYTEYEYDEWFINSKTLNLFINIDDLNFYEEVYVIATDFYGNSKTSDKIIPNKNRIYDLQDLLKFRTIVNNDISNFTDETVYLLNDIDLISVCSASVGNWETINGNFLGVFEGNNYTIANLYINTSSSYSGLFSEFYGTIQNLVLTGEIISSRRIYRRFCWKFISRNFTELYQ